jgi:hypothetical protein
VDGNGSGLCATADFGISTLEPSGYVAIVLVFLRMFLNHIQFKLHNNSFHGIHFWFV